LSKWEKLIARIRNNPKAVSFEEVAKVLESIGYEKRQPRSGSSYWTFRKKGVLPLTIPKKEPYVKEAYVRQVILALDDADA